MGEKEHVLFLCTHNAARSQIAEAILRHRAGDWFEVMSAGLKPSAVHPFARQVLEEIGIESSGLSAKGIGRFLGKVKIDYAIVVCEETEVVCPRVYPFALRTLHWPFDDPAREADSELGLARFRRVRSQIDDRIRDWLQELRR